jgi:hypothetical protein
MRQIRETQLREKQKRIPPGKPRLKLTVEGLKPNERAYWAKPSQFEELTEGGYTFVPKEGITIGTDGIGNTDLGSLVSRPAGSGDRLYLMKIRKSYYEENQREKQKELELIEKQIRNPQGNNIYVPDDGISITNELIGAK